MNLDHLNEKISPNHIAALNWFNENKGSEMHLPKPIQTNDGEARLYTQAKGIYKPQGSDFSLSIKVVIDSPYPNKFIVYNDDGWLLEYHQEGEDTEYFTNKGLLNNIKTLVPIGLFYQKSKRPAIYKICGLGIVEKYDDGYFYIKGANEQGIYKPNINKASEKIIKKITAEAEDAPPSNNLKDARERVLRQIVKRKGQSRFRSNLLRAYQNKCAITNCQADAVLEAAHIVPYLGDQSNHITNGILLRADIHTLWDRGLIWIDESTMQINVHRSLAETEYYELNNKEPHLPNQSESTPGLQNLQQHREYCSDNI